MIVAELHDAKVNDPVKNGMRGPTHAGTLRVDYEYQFEEHLKEIHADHPDIVLIKVRDGREYRRGATAFELASPQAKDPGPR